MGQAPDKNSRVVVLKHMFTLDELEKDASLLLDLKEDVREECETLGEVTNVVLYDVGYSFVQQPLWPMISAVGGARWCNDNQISGSNQCSSLRDREC